MSNQKPFKLKDAALLINLSVEAYQNEGNINIEQYGLKLHKFIENTKTDTQCFIANDESRIIIVFRGATDLHDYYTDAKVLQVKYPPVKRRFFFFFRVPRVHKGFHNAYQSVKQEILAEIQSLMKTKKHEIFITGHSLGAALAVLCAVDIENVLNQPIMLYNFGCPIIGNKHFVKNFKKRNITSYRVVNDEDIVAKIWLPGYHHVPQLVFIDGKKRIKMKLSKLDKVKETLDDIPSLLTGEAVKDHRSPSYQTIINDLVES
ncbi:MAG: lipase family protein [Candidatus Hodarchaeales archaeon]|jgi:predicted lipase